MWNRFLILLLFNFVSQIYGDDDTNQGESNNTDGIPDTDYFPTLDVVGGHDIDIKQVPYHVAVINKGKYYCGGVIIKNDVVITAAHCVVGLKANQVQIRAGSNFNYTDGVVVNATNLLAHPDYTFSKKDSDIGIIWLSQPLEYSDVIQQIEMATAGQEIAVDAKCFVSGWGYITPGGPFAKHLQGVEVPIVSHDECNEDYGNKITSTMLCAGYKAGGKDACTYDSGGPLTHNGTLYGIVSWGRGCASPYFPGVYAKVSTLSTWINTHVRTEPKK